MIRSSTSSLFCFFTQSQGKAQNLQFTRYTLTITHKIKKSFILTILFRIMQRFRILLFKVNPGCTLTCTPLTTSLYSATMCVGTVRHMRAHPFSILAMPLPLGTRRHFSSSLLLRADQVPPPHEAAGGAVEADAETHPDFQPRAVTTESSPEEIEMIKKDIDETIRDENVVIFIKGVPEAPMCAFSKKMVDVMECLGLEYTSFDVLAHPFVRSYVKVVSEWPTIPQLFVKGEFVGGMDIVLKLAEEGELQSLLDAKGIQHRDTKKE